MPERPIFRTDYPISLPTDLWMDYYGFVCAQVLRDMKEKTSGSLTMHDLGQEQGGHYTDYAWIDFDCVSVSDSLV